nr:ammonium transporter [Ferroplasma acidiphilum]
MVLIIMLLNSMILYFTTIPDSTSWLNTGNNGWMLTASTLVGLMSIPGLAIYYAGLTKRKYMVNAMMMALYAFAAVLIIWILAGYNFGFGTSSLLKIDGYYIFGIPSPAGAGSFISGQAIVGPLKDALTIPNSTVMFFQFVFAAITPILLLGGILERMNFKAWMIFVPIWSLVVYSPVAYWLFAGGWLNQLGAVDFSGGYVIHLDAGIGALAAAFVIGPRLKDEMKMKANNLGLVMLGLGLIWLGWDGFNGGDPYGATIDAGIAIINTNVATAVSMMTWMFMDLKFFKKPSLIGASVGAIAGLVGITPAAGYVNIYGAMVIGIATGIIPWIFLYKIEPKFKVDDSLGVFSSHAVAGVVGGLLTGVLADPVVTQYIDPGLRGALYGNFYELGIQAFAAVIVILYVFALTYGLLRLIGVFIPLRETNARLKIGDMAIHGEAGLDITGYPPSPPMHAIEHNNIHMEGNEKIDKD